MVAPGVFTPHDATFEEVRRRVVELLGHFLADAAPRLGARLHRLGIDQLLDHRQMLRNARPALTRRRWSRRAPWGLRGHGLRGFSRRIESLQHQEQLARINLFALRAIEPFDQRIDLFAQQLVLALQLDKLCRRARELLG